MTRRGNPFKPGALLAVRDNGRTVMNETQPGRARWITVRDSDGSARKRPWTEFRPAIETMPMVH